MGRSITKEEIAKYDIEEFPGEIFVIDNLSDANKAVEYLSKFKKIGFDTETRPAFRKGSIHGVALIQLATDDICFLFRINTMDFPLSLTNLLSNPNILKIGLDRKSVV